MCEWNTSELTAAFLKYKWNIYVLFVKIVYNICIALFYLCRLVLMKFHQFMTFFQQGKVLSSIWNRCKRSTIDVYIPHRKYQTRLHSSQWLSAACAAAIVHRNHFSCLYQKDKSSNSKVKFSHTNNRCESVLEVTKLAYANKTKASITSQKLALGTSGELKIVFSAKVNLLYILYLTTRRYCLLHLIKQNCLLKTFLRTLILMAQVSLYLFSLLELIWNCIIFP